MEGKVKAEGKTTLSAIIIHADGTTEDLGVISVNGQPVKSSRIKQMWRKLKARFGRGK